MLLFVQNPMKYEFHPSLSLFQECIIISACVYRLVVLSLAYCSIYLVSEKLQFSKCQQVQGGEKGDD